METKRKYDLEDRTIEFSRRVRVFVRTLPESCSNVEDRRQLIRASGSIGANYVEANESLGNRDFLMHIKICRKESKEARYWLALVDTPMETEAEQNELIREATELMNIFGAIVRKSRQN